MRSIPGTPGRTSLWPTPYKLRNRESDGEFYTPTKLPNGRRVRIPLSYYDQIRPGRPSGRARTQGNMYMMGLGQCYFVVLSPSGYHVQIEPLDLSYCEGSLFPSLERFCRVPVRPGGGIAVWGLVSSVVVGSARRSA